jgi:hypothetical protein
MARIFGRQPIPVQVEHDDPGQRHWEIARDSAHPYSVYLNTGPGFTAITFTWDDGTPRAFTLPPSGYCIARKRFEKFLEGTDWKLKYQDRPSDTASSDTYFRGTNGTLILYFASPTDCILVVAALSERHRSR